MANIYPYEIDLIFKSENDLKKGMKTLSEFFTYDYIGKERYKIDGLNLKMNVSYQSNEDECHFDEYLDVEEESHLDDILYDIDSIIENGIKRCNSKTESIFIKSYFHQIGWIVKRYKKFQIMKNVLNKCEKYSFSFFDYSEDENGNEIKRYTKHYSN